MLRNGSSERPTEKIPHITPLFFAVRRFAPSIRHRAVQCSGASAAFSLSISSRIWTRSSQTSDSFNSLMDNTNAPGVGAFVFSFYGRANSVRSLCGAHHGATLAAGTGLRAGSARGLCS